MLWKFGIQTPHLIRHLMEKNGSQWIEGKKSVPSARFFNNTMKVLLFHHLRHRAVARPQEIDAVGVTGEVDLHGL